MAFDTSHRTIRFKTLTLKYLQIGMIVALSIYLAGCGMSMQAKGPDLSLSTQFIPPLNYLQGELKRDIYKPRPLKKR